MSEPRVVRVELGERGYDICIGPNLLARARLWIDPIVTGRRHVHIVSDENVWPLHASALEAGLRVGKITTSKTILPAGERSKSFSGLEQVLEDALAAEMERGDLFIALGGGIVGDLTGLAAGLLKRGSGFIQIPTTLLAQVDSSVGGKTAINSSHGKNLIGLFHQPTLVLADTSVLRTLPDRERLAGLAEIIKYGLINDYEFFEWLERRSDGVIALEDAALSHAVQRSCKNKARIVAEDETEKGQRALLNLGHTFGHALERANGFAPTVLHGEAVATGCMMAFRMSERLGLCPMADVKRVEALLKRCGYATSLADLPGGPYRSGELHEHMKQDKKVQNGRMTLILARGIGQSFVEKDVDQADLLRFLKAEEAIPA